MKDRKFFHQFLKRVEELAHGERLDRLKAHPYRYAKAVLVNKVLYRLSKIPYHTNTRTFWKRKFRVALPAATDIYLTGGKTHDSEIRLTKFLINNIEPEWISFDIGAHYGFYALLLADLSPQGRVYAFEPAPANFKLLKKNTVKAPNILLNNTAVSDITGELKFYEFPALYSEYNTIDQTQYADAKWFKKNKGREIITQSVELDSFCANAGVVPRFIKIDVEGAEHKVLSGGEHVLTSNPVYLSIEFLADSNSDDNYSKATSFLTSRGYRIYAIDQRGFLKQIYNIPEYMKEKNLDSDNIIFFNDRF